MKHTLRTLFKTTAVFVLLALACLGAQAKEVKLLAIGNSFAWSLNTYLPKVANSVDDCKLVFKFAAFGGCELSRHWKYISQEEADPAKKIYFNGKRTLRDILKDTEWDIITIQQASHESWRPETYFPYAQNIVDFIKKYRPGAKIAIQQTWSYRSDCALLKKWKFDNSEMFKRAQSAYNTAAQKLGLEQIPTGIAVQLARETLPEKFAAPAKGELATYRYPDLPRQAGDIVGKYFWQKNKEGEMQLKTDCIHLNNYGEYLQACVWFAFLFDRPATDITYTPPNMSEARAKKFREIADQAIARIKHKNINNTRNK